MSIIKQTSADRHEGALGKIRSYSEVVEYLDGLKSIEHGEASLKRMQKLDKIFDNVSQAVPTILVGGSNAKSSTINFASKLLKEEGYKVGAVYSSHFLSYNERLSLESVTIQNKRFTELLNEVINAAEMSKIVATSFELMTMAALLYFKAEQVDVALLEVGLGGLYDATNICSPKICALTRVAEDHVDVLGKDLDAQTREMIGIAKAGSWFVSAEQSKIRLQKMKDWVEERGAKWAMPIRKLATLPYIFEQLYGRSASLAERIAQIFVEEINGKFSPFLRGNLLATQRGQRGRPTLEAKRAAELNPIKTLKSFWHETFELLRGRFELLDKEKPTILLDNAHNVDALSNVFLGIRLLHYQRTLNGLALVIGLDEYHNISEVMKYVRYLFKKVPGQIFFVPVPGSKLYHEPLELVRIAQNMHLKAKASFSFEEAFQMAKNAVDERQGLVAICGSAALVTEYWKIKGIKKFPQ